MYIISRTNITEIISIQKLFYEILYYIVDSKILYSKIFFYIKNDNNNAYIIILWVDIKKIYRGNYTVKTIYGLKILKKKKNYGYWWL